MALYITRVAAYLMFIFSPWIKEKKLSLVGKHGINKSKYGISKSRFTSRTNSLYVIVDKKILNANSYVRLKIPV